MQSSVKLFGFNWLSHLTSARCRCPSQLPWLLAHCAARSKPLIQCRKKTQNRGERGGAPRVSPPFGLCGLECLWSLCVQGFRSGTLPRGCPAEGSGPALLGTRGRKQRSCFGRRHRHGNQEKAWGRIWAAVGDFGLKLGGGLLNWHEGWNVGTDVGMWFCNSQLGACSVVPV